MLFGFKDIRIVMIVIINIDSWLVMINFLFDVLCLKNVWYKFFVIVFVVIRSWEEIEFIMVVKIVDSKNFVINGWNNILEKIMKIVLGLFIVILNLCV